MSFITGKKQGQYWEDAKRINKLIETFNFYQTGKDEAYFESNLASHFDSHREEFNLKLNSQRAGNSKVNGVDCFGKKHRPDIAFSNKKTDEGIIAVELKYANYGKIAKAIGQCMIYRLKYRFVFMILVIPASTIKNPKNSNRLNIEKYVSISNNKDEELISLCDSLKENNIFVFLAPAFKTEKIDAEKMISYF